MGGSNDLYVYRCTGNSQTRWNTTDEVITTDLKTSVNSLKNYYIKL